jgi:hypothetical protein
LLNFTGDSAPSDSVFFRKILYSINFQKSEKDKVLSSAEQATLDSIYAAAKRSAESGLVSNGMSNDLGANISSGDDLDGSELGRKNERLAELLARCKLFVDDMESFIEGYSSSISSDSSNKGTINPLSVSSDGHDHTKLTLLEDSLCGTLLSNAARNTDIKSKDYSIFVIPIQIIVANIRHLKFSQTKIACLLLLLKFGLLTTDNIIVNRIVPAILYLIEDPSNGSSKDVTNPSVKAMGIRCLCTLLYSVKESVEMNIFPSYIFPAIGKLTKDPEIAVKVAFAESIGRFAVSAKRFLERAQLAAQSKALEQAVGSSDSSSYSGGGSGGVNASDDVAVVVDFAYDAKLKVLHDQANRWIRELIVDGTQNSGTNGVTESETFNGSNLASYGSVLKKALLFDLVRLCEFFGQLATTELLAHLLTFLNDPDWELRYAFCEKVTSICVFVGAATTSEWVLPCVENALRDVEERVVACAVKCLNSLVQLQLLSRVVVLELFPNILPLLLHPSPAIQSNAVQFITSTCKLLGPLDTMVFVYPNIQPYLNVGVKSIEHHLDSLHLAILPPISRRAFKRAIHLRLNSKTATNDDDNVARQSSVDSTTANSSVAIGSSDVMDDYSIVFVSENVGSNNNGNNSPLAASKPSNNGDRNSELFPKSSAKIVDLSQDIFECSPADSAKLQLMSKYITHLSREMNTKTLQWKNSSHLETSKFSSSGGREYFANSIEKILDNSVRYVQSSCATHQGLVPHQKYGSNFQPLSEEIRRQLLESKDPIELANLTNMSDKRLKKLYGYSTRSYAERRPTTLTAPEDAYIGQGGGPPSKQY